VHAHIEQHDIMPVEHIAFESLSAVLCFLDRMSEFLEQLAHHAARQTRIVDDQNSSDHKYLVMASAIVSR
jgi:hypothetical protein